MTIDIPYDDPGSNDFVLYSVQEDNDDINIFPNSGYYKQYSSNEIMEFHPEHDIYCSDYIKNSQWQIYFSNNSTETKKFNKIRVFVVSSKLDTFPYIYIEQGYYKRFSMQILNECWANWGTMTIEYSFDKKGKPFNGSYDHTLTIPYFEDKAIIDFRSDLIADGYDYAKVDSYLPEYGGNDDYNEELLGVPIFGHSAKLSDLSGPMLPNLSPDLLSEIAYPFEYGYGFEDVPYLFTRIHARISFYNSNFTKEITGDIPLTCFYPGGAEDEIDDNFDILLNSEGENYYFDMPYITTLHL